MIIMNSDEVAGMTAEIERLRNVLREISKLDYDVTAMNCAAYRAVKLARTALLPRIGDFDGINKPLGW